MNDFKEWLSDYLRYFLLGFAILAVIAIAIIGITVYKKLSDPAPKTQIENKVPVETESDMTESGKDTEAPETDKDTKEITEAATTEDSAESESGQETEPETNAGTESEEESTEAFSGGETEENPEYVKLTTSLNLRSGPGTEYDVMNTYGSGRIAKVLEESNGWYKVRIGGQDGYFSSEYVEKTAYEAGMEQEVETEPETEAPTEGSPIYKILKGSCYLRADTSTDSEILGTYPAGYTVQFLEDVGGWYRVQVDGMIGYMGAKFF